MAGIWIAVLHEGGPQAAHAPRQLALGAGQELEVVAEDEGHLGPVERALDGGVSEVHGRLGRHGEVVHVGSALGHLREAQRRAADRGVPCGAHGRVEVGRLLARQVLRGAAPPTSRQRPLQRRGLVERPHLRADGWAVEGRGPLVEVGGIRAAAQSRGEHHELSAFVQVCAQQHVNAWGELAPIHQVHQRVRQVDPIHHGGPSVGLEGVIPWHRERHRVQQRGLRPEEALRPLTDVAWAALHVGNKGGDVLDLEVENVVTVAVDVGGLSVFRLSGEAHARGGAVAPPLRHSERLVEAGAEDAAVGAVAAEDVGRERRVAGGSRATWAVEGGQGRQGILVVLRRVCHRLHLGEPRRLQDRPLEELRGRPAARDEVEGDGGGAGGLARDGDTRGVAAKGCDVLSDPLEGQALVQHAVVACAIPRVPSPEVLGAEVAEGPDAVIEGHVNEVLRELRPVRLVVVRRAAVELAGVEVD
mmetsp:Transcript_136187/g.435686  ORF Transcript_136187/g.435686 Transcript_136187/m.435686 type:complete len:473 (-) Transcript_136187:408-1826(-)